MKKTQKLFVLSMFVVLSLVIMGGSGVQAQTNIPPTVNAGIDITISVNDVTTTVIYGSVTDPDNTGFLKCAWENNVQQLTPLMDVLNGICPLELSTLNNPSAGIYTLVLYGLDGTVITSDTMSLTLVDSNSGPIANAGPDITITTDQIATTMLQGTIINPYNTDPLRCAWYENGVVQASYIFDVGANGECPLDLSNSLIDFTTGSYTLVIYGIDDSVIYSDSMILTIIPSVNTPATVNAGNDLTITSDEISTTVIQGIVTDPDNTGTLLCAWEDQNYQQLTPLKDVVNNICELDLTGLVGSQYFGIGEYTLTLYGLDGSFISSDSMILTIVDANAAPVADAGVDIIVSSEEVATTVIQGYVTDPDAGDILECRWTEASNILQNWIYAGIGGECPLGLGSLSLGVGTHTLMLEVDDGHTTSADIMQLTVSNSTPHADAGATTSNINTCLATSCEITLDGSQSTDFDNDIVSWQWIENGVIIGTGEVIQVSLSLDVHDISLRVTDSANNSDEVLIQVVIAPAALSFIDIDKAKLDWMNGKLKLKGKIALPAGVSYLTTNSVGSAAVNLLTVGTLINEAVDFSTHDNGKKWKYHTDTSLGITNFKIDWKGEKFNYKENCIQIKSHHFGIDTATVQVEFCNKSIGPVTVDFGGGITVHLDATGQTSVTGLASSEYEIDNDDAETEAELVLPFSITESNTISISGTINELVLVADYYNAAVGKFTIDARFDPSGIDPALDPSLMLDIALGNEGFSGALEIDPITWTKKKDKECKYERND